MTELMYEQVYRSAINNLGLKLLSIEQKPNVRAATGSDRLFTWIKARNPETGKTHSFFFNYQQDRPDQNNVQSIERWAREQLGQ